jgi:hypothetical protein
MLSLQTVNEPSPLPSSSAPGPTTHPSPAEPLTATLQFYDPCESFSIPKSILPSIPTDDTYFDAGWIYEHGGATLGQLGVVLQTNTDDPVIITRLRVVELKRNDPPPDVISIHSCGESGSEVEARSFEVNMKDKPKIIPRATQYWHSQDLPFMVSGTNLDILSFKVTGPDCFCDWRLAIDWRTHDRKGTTVVGRRFESIRSDTRDYKDRPAYRLINGEWQQV